VERRRGDGPVIGAQESRRETPAIAGSIRVRCLYPFAEREQAQLRAVSPALAITFSPPDGPAQANAVINRDAEVLLSNFCPSDLSGFPKLKWLALAGAGVEHLRAADPWARGITVTNGSGLHATPMGEFVMSSLLWFSQRMRDRIANQEQRGWPPPNVERWVNLLASPLRGRTITVVGYGSIGREVARLADAFGMRVLAVKARPDQLVDAGYTPPGIGDPSGRIPAEVVSPDQIPRCFAESNFVALTLPWTPATDRIVDRKAISALPRDAVLVNVARGKIIDEEALVEALTSGSIRGAVIDVAAAEPVPPESPLWQVPNLVLTPHVSGNNDPAGQWFALAALMAENLGRYGSKRELLNIVNAARGY
jgi:phosphoglycerate dehydrogenase-like enzyme